MKRYTIVYDVCVLFAAFEVQDELLFWNMMYIPEVITFGEQVNAIFNVTY